VFTYDEHSRRLVLGLKYADKTHLVPTLGAWLARAGEELITGSDLIIPLPLHPLRLMKRRFNQSALLARAVARSSGLPLVEGLRRIRHTQPQAGLTRRERRENVRRAFAPHTRHLASLKDKRILLIDDVMTTGATIEACTQALKQAGVRQVNVLTLAKAVLD
jgi:ComF family protein